MISINRIKINRKKALDWNALEICLFGQTTKQTSSKFEP